MYKFSFESRTRGLEKRLGLMHVRGSSESSFMAAALHTANHGERHRQLSVQRLDVAVT